MSNPNMRLTMQGRNILARGLLGEEIHFTKAAYGDGDFDYDTESVFELTGLRNLRMNLPIVDKEILGDGTVIIVAQINNFNLEQGFRAKEIGIFAINQDTGEEVLYAYRNAGEEYNFIPAVSSANLIRNSRHAFRVEIGDAENVTFEINFDFAYVSREIFDSHVESTNPHPNMPVLNGNMPEAVDSTETFSSIYVANEDSDLWQMSLEQAKEIITQEIKEKVSSMSKESQKIKEILKAQAELSFDASIILVEDFSDSTAISKLKIKVNACVQGGNKIGIESSRKLRTGEIYTISDNINSEKIQIETIIFDENGLYIKTLEPLSQSYDLSETYIYSTTNAGAEKKSFTWSNRTAFLGHGANVERRKNFDTSSENRNAFEISDDGILTSDGYFSMWK